MAATTTDEQLIAVIQQAATKITREQVESATPKLIRNFLNARDGSRPLYVNLATTKIGSEQWLYLLIKDMLPQHKIVLGPQDLDQTRGIDILYLDDWILSGSNAIGTMERVLWDHFDNLSDVHYYIRSYVATSASCQLVKETQAIYKNVLIHQSCGKTVDKLSTVLSQEGSYTLPDGSSFQTPLSVSAKEWDTFHAKQNPGTLSESHLIYSDYKMPNEFGSYPRIYQQIIPSVDRKFMDDVQRECEKFLAQQ